MSLLPITRSDIQDHTSGGSFDRGETYLADGAVRSLKRADENTLKAQVQGSDVHPYLVTINFDEDDITAVQCTCPYVEGSWCKHIAAVLLKTLEEDEVPAEESVEVAELVEGLDRSQLVSLIERLAEHDPRLVDQIERERVRLSGDA
jgi:uncharacterized Zn finger protein